MTDLLIVLTNQNDIINAQNTIVDYDVNINISSHLGKEVLRLFGQMKLLTLWDQLTLMVI